MKVFDESFHHAWKQNTHAKYFDANAILTKSMLSKIYETKNEVCLLNKYKGNAKGKTLMEVGCATGEFYRYLQMKNPGLKYIGFDISPPAIGRAKEKYPQANFNVSTEDVLSVKEVCESPDIVFCKDVVLHQNKPFEFLEKILTIPKDSIFLRIRTKDKGETELNPELSCQRHYDTWVPYMVLNIDEVLGLIKKTRNCSKIIVQKHYQQLGGYVGRYLPKDCYLEETGTAETAIYVQYSDTPVDNPEIIIESKVDSFPQFSIVERVIHKVKTKLLS